jgi:hypothetical protein
MPASWIEPLLSAESMLALSTRKISRADGQQKCPDRSRHVAS